MNTDRKLLELAAKAAGFDVEWREWITSRMAEFRRIKHTKHAGFWIEDRQWNPLTDDGDALRLAHKLGMDVDMCACWVAYEGRDEVHTIEFGCTITEARRAITRAAAEIGKAMP